MGHYDEFYEQETEKNYDELKAECKSKIEYALYEMDLDELRLLARVVDNLSGLQALSNILNLNK